MDTEVWPFDAIGKSALGATLEVRQHVAPEAVALSDGRGVLTHGQLSRASDHIAAILRSKRVGPGSTVGIWMDRRVEAVVGMLAVLKAGAAYVPLEPDQPAERLQYMVRDSRCLAVLTQPSYTREAERSGVQLVVVEEPFESIQRDSGAELAAPSGPYEVAHSNDVAYVIYTSGSTGPPKGVAATYGGLLNLCRWHIGRYEVSPQDRVVQVASFAFDASVWDLWPNLLAGAAIYLVPEDIRVDNDLLIDYLMDRAATISFLPTPLAERLLRSQRCLKMSTLRYLLVGGDTLRVRPLAGCPFSVINHYGPTEATVLATAGEVTASGVGALPTIGRPIPNVKVYLLDSDLNTVPRGAIGEIYIAGAGVARGYVGNPRNTAASFLPDPFLSEPGSRMYRTGDLARWLATGDLEFLGRSDRQVKVRGQRIELGELESVLLSHPQVSQAVVEPFFSPKGDQGLTAYVATTSLTSQDIRSYLMARLPQKMLPQRILVLPELPLTTSGKLDRKAILKLTSELSLTSDPLEPRDHVEATVLRLWDQFLGRPQALDENYFATGGESLGAADLLANVYRELGVRVSLSEFTREPTPGALVTRIRADKNTVRMEPSAQPASSISPGQRSLWFLHQIEPGSSAYNIPIAYWVHGKLIPEMLRAALSEIVLRHQGLRTYFIEENGVLMARVADNPPVRFQIRDVGDPERGSGDNEAMRLARIEARIPFRLEREIPIRAVLFKVRPDLHLLLVLVHHIAFDGTSLLIFESELSESCRAFIQSGSSGPITGEFRPGVSAREPQDDAYSDEDIAFWRETLAGAPPMIQLATKTRPRIVGTSRGGVTTRILDSRLWCQAKELGRKNGATPFTLLLALYATLLGRYAGQSDVVIGVPAALGGRHGHTIGFHLNTLPLRVDLSGSPDLAELLRRARRTTVTAYEHRNVPFDRVVQALRPLRDPSFHPIFQTSLVVQPPGGTGVAVPSLRFEPVRIWNNTAKFDLSLLAFEVGANLELVLEYNSQLFEGWWAKRMLGHLEALLGEAVAFPDKDITALPFMPTRERRFAAGAYSGVSQQRDPNLKIEHLFEEQARLSPRRVAVSEGPRELNYSELNELADYFGELIRRYVGGEGDVVGVCMTRCIEWVATLLGTLKAGGAYLPLDPSLPRQRLEYMIRDSACRLVVTQHEYADSFAGLGIPVVIAESPSAKPIVTARGRRPELGGGAALAYVIYTSGSTGKPKGVLAPHTSMVNRLLWMRESFPPADDDLSCQRTPLSFVDSLTETLGPLISGCPLKLIGEDSTRDLDRLMFEIHASRATRLVIVPSLLSRLVANIHAAEWLATLRTCFVSGEPLKASLAREFARVLPRCQLVNLYGSSEIAGDVTFHAPSPGHVDEAIGRPLPNVTCYVLDNKLQPVPLGVSGRLWIGGDALARGYIRSPSLTALRFRPDPYSAKPGARMYDTGDLVHCRRDGALVYHGRDDRRVKIGGARVELDEVESVMAACPGVEQVAVLLREIKGGEIVHLAAAVVPSGPELDLSVLRRHLQAQLPQYMIPSIIVSQPTLPRLATGKIDRRALTELFFKTVSTEDFAPSVSTADRLKEIWSQLLGQSDLPDQGSLFDLGATSLLLLEAKARITQSFGLELPVMTFFEYPSIRLLAEHINERLGAASSS
jgi:amino acid adenylation domain-containing protein